MLKTSVMKYSLLLGAIVISMTGYAQAWTKQYDHVDDCVCGLSLVGKGEKHGFVDKNGKLVDWVYAKEQTAQSMLKILGY